VERIEAEIDENSMIEERKFGKKVFEKRINDGM
jgi:hypothetical protein